MSLAGRKIMRQRRKAIEDEQRREWQRKYDARRKAQAAERAKQRGEKIADAGSLIGLLTGIVGATCPHDRICSHTMTCMECVAGGGPIGWPR